MARGNNTHSKTHIVINPDRGIVVSKITVERKTVGNKETTRTRQQTESLTWERGR